MSDNIPLGDIEKEAISATVVITGLLKKYLPGPFEMPDFFPQIDICEQFQQQENLLSAIQEWFSDKDLTDVEKVELKEALLKAFRMFYKLAERKIKMNANEEMLAVCKNFILKKRRDNG